MVENSMQTGAPFPTLYWESEAREADLPPIQWRIPGLLPVGLTICAAPVKIGKSFIAQQIEHFLAAGQPLFGLVHPEPMPCLVVDFEGNFRRTHTRSLIVSPEADCSIVRYVHPGDPKLRDVTTGMARIEWLDAYLATARDNGITFGHVRIDTYRLFLGSRPRDANAYDFDTAMSTALDAVAHKHQVSILAMHHTRKPSEEQDWVDRFSGSAGVAAGATGLWLLERTRGSVEGVLNVTGRDGQEATLPVRFCGGAWSLAEDLTVTQARRQRGSVPRAVVDYLTAVGPLCLSELAGGISAPANTIQRALDRLRLDGDVEWRPDGEPGKGRWHLVLPPAPLAVLDQGDELGQAGPAAGPAETAAMPDFDGSDRPGTDTSADLGEEGESSGGGRGGTNVAITELVSVIESARTRPVKNIRVADRVTPPWSLAQECLVGRHRWVNPDAETYIDGYRAVVLDRNGDFPAAMSSVAVAPNVLTHTGRMELDQVKGRAGIFLLSPATMRQESPNVPPLFGLHGSDGQPEWFPSPLVEHAIKLGTCPPILDSWTGKRSTALFERWSAWAREAREKARVDGPEAYEEIKRQINIAIRVIWPRENNRGRLWRPDWWASIVAEANVRHWIMATRCQLPLLALQAVDELVIAWPADTPLPAMPAPGEAPEPLPGTPYKLGYGFGQVKIKGHVSVAQWIAFGHRLEPRKPREQR